MYIWECAPSPVRPSVGRLISSAARIAVRKSRKKGVPVGQAFPSLDAIAEPEPPQPKRSDVIENEP